MQTLIWNTSTRTVSFSALSRVGAQVQSVRGDEQINVVVVNGTPTAAYLPDASLNLGIVIRPPANLKQGCLGGPTLLTRGATAAAGYTGTTSTDTTLTRELMHVDDDDPATELPTFSATAVLYLVPAAGGDAIESLPFAWTITGNYYRPLQPPADVIETYPTAAAVTALVNPYKITAAAITAGSGTVALPAGTLRVVCDEPLPRNLIIQLPAASGYNPGVTLDIYVTSVNGHTVSLRPANNADTLDGLAYSSSAQVAISASAPSPTSVRLHLNASGAAWQTIPPAGALPSSLTGLVYANGASAPTAATGYQVATAFSGLGINPSSIGGTGALTGLYLNGCYVNWSTVTNSTQGLNWFRSAMWGARLRADATTGDLVFYSTTSGSEVERLRVSNVGGDVTVGGALTSQNLTLGIGTGAGLSTVTARYFPGVGGADVVTFKTFSGDGNDVYSRLTITSAVGSSHPGTASVRVDNADLQVNGTVRLTGLLKPGSYTVSTLPSASSSTGMATVVSNPASGKRGDVLSDGTNWRYSDNSIV